MTSPQDQIKPELEIKKRIGFIYDPKKGRYTWNVKGEALHRIAAETFISNVKREQQIKSLESALEAKEVKYQELLKVAKEMREALDLIEANYDHEDSTRGCVAEHQDHNRCYCRCCIAKEALTAFEALSLEEKDSK